LNRWYAPFNPNFSLGSPAGKHCDGTTIGSNETTPMVRVLGTSITTNGTTPIDWNYDSVANDVGRSQDVSFNGVTNTSANLLKGAEDWSYIGGLGLKQL